MKKPEVENPKLKKIVDKLWVDTPNPIGDGSIADAIRHERKTGKPTKGRFHSKKGKDAIQALRNWLSGKARTKSASDKKVAREIIEDLRDALGESDDTNER